MGADHRNRSQKRGAAMVEAVCVLSVFVIFFIGIAYFRVLYQEKLRVQRLARAAAVAYAMDACPDGQALSSIKPDLGKASDNESGSTPAPASTDMQPNAKVGNTGSDPVGSAMSDQGFAFDKIDGISLRATASNVSSPTAGNRPWFSSEVHSNSFMSCGDVQKGGDIGGAIDYAKNAIRW